MNNLNSGTFYNNVSVDSKIDLDRLEKSQQLLKLELEQSQSALEQLDQRRKLLKTVINKKIWQIHNDSEIRSKEIDQKITEYLFRANDCLRNKLYEQTIKECENILLLAPNNTKALELYQTAEIKIQEIKDIQEIEEQKVIQKQRLKSEKLAVAKEMILENQYKEALEVLNHATRNFGVHPEINILIHECELKLSEQNKSNDVTIDINNHKIFEIKKMLILAKRFLFKKNYDKAIEIFEKIINIDPDNTEALNLLFDAEELLSQLEQNQNEILLKEQFSNEFNKAMQLFNAEQFFDAYMSFKKALTIYPKDQDAILLKEKSLLAYNDKQQKFLVINQLKTEFDNKFQILKTKIQEFIHENNYNIAIDECNKLLILYPSNSQILKEIETIEEFKKTYELEQKTNKFKLIELQNNQKKILINELLIKSKIELNSNSFDLAIKYLYEALGIDPNNIDILQKVSEIEKTKNEYYFNQNSINEKVEKHTKTEQTKREITDLKIELFNEYYLSNFVNSLIICEKILLLDPQNIEIIDFKKMILNKKQQQEEEIQNQKQIDQNILVQQNEKINEKSKNNLLETKNIYEIGLDLYRKNNYEQAIQEWEKIRFIDSSNEFIIDEIKKAKNKIKEIELTEFQKAEFKKQNEQKSTELWFNARLLIRNEQYGQALETLEQAVLLIGREKYLVDEIDKVQNIIYKKKIEDERKRQNALTKHKAINHLIFQAHRYYNNYQFKEALICFEKALNFDPDNMEIKDGILNAEDKLRRETGKYVELPNIDRKFDNNLTIDEVDLNL